MFRSISVSVGTKHPADRTRTSMNLYKLRGLVCKFRRPMVAYLVLPCISGSEFVRELVDETMGSDVVPVRRHFNTTSLNTTSHKSFLPPIPEPDPNVSLKRRSDVLPLMFLFAIAGGGLDPLDVLDEASRPTAANGFSSIRSREGLGVASCLTLSNPSIRANTSLVLSRSSFWIFSSSILLTIVSTSATICSVLSYSNVLGSVWKRRFWKRRGYLSNRWNGFESVMARLVSPLSQASSSTRCKLLQTFSQSAES